MKLVLPDSGAETLPDGRRLVPSAERNAAPILALLHQVLPARGRLLELAAGSGLHSARFAAALPGLDWQPTDVEPENFASIRAWTAGHANVRPPRLVDASAAGWAADWAGQDAVLLVNLLHLLPLPAAEAVLDGMAAALAPGGVALVYGPFLRDGQATSPGDAAFDASLRAQDPAIGYKDIAWAVTRLQGHGLTTALHELPANNLMLVAASHSK